MCYQCRFFGFISRAFCDEAQPLVFIISLTFRGGDCEHPVHVVVRGLEGERGKNKYRCNWIYLPPSFDESQ